MIMLCHNYKLQITNAADTACERAAHSDQPGTKIRNHQKARLLRQCCLVVLAVVNQPGNETGLLVMALPTAFPSILFHCMNAGVDRQGIRHVHMDLKTCFLRSCRQLRAAKWCCGASAAKAAPTTQAAEHCRGVGPRKNLAGNVHMHLSQLILINH